MEVKSESVEHRIYRVYGESEVNTTERYNKFTKITAFGESYFRVGVSDHLKVAGNDECTRNFTGEATVDKGIVIAETEIRSSG